MRTQDPSRLPWVALKNRLIHRDCQDGGPRYEYQCYTKQLGGKSAPNNCSVFQNGKTIGSMRFCQKSLQNTIPLPNGCHATARSLLCLFSVLCVIGAHCQNDMYMLHVITCGCTYMNLYLHATANSIAIPPPSLFLSPYTYTLCHTY